MLKVNPSRECCRVISETGYYVRTFDEESGKWVTVDLIKFDKESLIKWLENYDKNELINIICNLLGYID